MDLAQAAFHLHQVQDDWQLPLRSIGLRACTLIPTSQHRQITIFDRNYQTDKSLALDKTIDNLRLRYGTDIITRRSLLQ